MASNKNVTILVVIGLIVIIALVAFFVFNPLDVLNPEGQAEITPPAATGDIDDLVDAMEKEIVDEMNLVYEEDEADLIISDMEEINDFGQSADDTGL